MSNLNDPEQEAKRKGLIDRILRSIGNSDFGQGLGQAFSLDSEDRRDSLLSYREAKGKAAMPPHAGSWSLAYVSSKDDRKITSRTDGRLAQGNRT